MADFMIGLIAGVGCSIILVYIICALRAADKKKRRCPYCKKEVE